MTTTQAEREMLETAAKACGRVYVDGGSWDEGASWDPLSDDGDCARMEAALGIEVRWDESRVLCSWNGAYLAENFANHNGDKQAARCLASLRVAAEIGRSMK